MPFFAFAITSNANAASNGWTEREVDILEIQSTQLVIDHANRIHICYFMWNNMMRYATNSNPYGNWSVVQVGTDVGIRSMSMALDSNDKAHISYFAGGSHQLIYATNAYGDFSTQVVDDDLVGMESSIAVDSANNVHISYVGANGLKYATNPGGIWNITQLHDAPYVAKDPTSIAVGSDGTIHIAYAAYQYYGSNSTTVYSIKHAWSSGAPWENETIASNGPSQAALDLTLDNLNRPHIAYVWGNPSAPVNLRLMHAQREVSGWSTPYKITDLADVPSTISLITDDSNEVHMSYDIASSGLYYATSSGGWSVENIVSRLNVGRGSSIDMDDNGMYFISYYDPGESYGLVRLKYVTTAELASEPWSFTATPSPNSIALHWNHPNSTGDYPRLGYTVKVYNQDPNYGVNVQPFISVGIPAANTSHVVTGLYNGAGYWMQVMENSRAGESETSPLLYVVPGELPTAPTGLRAEAHRNNITLSWSQPMYSNGSAVTNYSILWGLSSTALTTEIILDDQLSYVHHDLTPWQYYYYKVRAKNAIGWGPYSQVISVMAMGDAPLAPLDLTATAGNHIVNLSWSPPPITLFTPVVTYEIYKSDTTNFYAPTFSVNVGTTTYSDTDVTNGEIVYYRVAARNLNGTGPMSNLASATPTGTATAPSSPRSLSASAGNAMVTLTWSAPSNDGGSPITGYRVYRGTTLDGETLLTNIGNKLTFDDIDVTNNRTYFYKVSAVNSVGEGPLSNEAPATPMEPPGTGGNDLCFILIVIIFIVMVAIALLRWDDLLRLLGRGGGGS